MVIITFMSIGFLAMSHMHNTNVGGNNGGSANNGGNVETPDDGGNTETPDNGGNTETPDNGGNTETPDNGGNTETPENGGDVENPDNNGTQEKPDDGDTEDDKNDDNTTENVKIRVGYMAGPTGMGMAKLISDNGGLNGLSDKYSFTKYTDTTLAKTDLAAGKIDIICLPTNEAAAYNLKVDNDARVLAINCLNSLYFIEGLDIFGSREITLADLEGKTIYTCKNGTPRMVLEYIIKELGLDIDVSYSVNGKEILTPADLASLAIAGKIPNAVLPEPLVTSVVLNTKNKEVLSQIFEVKIDLTTEWEKISDTPIAMGCVIANGDFAKKNSHIIDLFLEEYKASIDYIGNAENIDSAANYVVETGVMAAAPAAKKALLNLGNSICYIDGNDMKETLVAFYNALGIALPDDSFYYEK